MSNERLQNSPLSGLRVVDFTHFLAGPMATMILADLGADVMKIENPAKGDDMRHFPPFDPRLDGQGPAFLWSNRNKRSVGINLKTEQGRAIARELVMGADIVVENFSGQVMKKLGLDYASFADAHPRLIYCSVAAYGRTGSLANRPGFDPVMQAEAGFMSLNGYDDRPGVRTGSSVIDISTGMMASNAIMAAVIARFRTGRGQHVEVSLHDTAFTMTGYVTAQHLFTGYEPKRNGNGSPDTVPTGVIDTADHPIFLVCSNTVIFQRLFRDVLNMPEIADDPALFAPRDRLAQKERVVGLVQEAFRKDTRDNWLAKLRAASVTAGAVRTIAEAVRSEEVAQRGLVTHIPHPTAGTVPNVALPMRFSDTPVVAPVAAPMLSQHTEEVLREALGFDDKQIEEARASGAFS